MNQGRPGSFLLNWPNLSRWLTILIAIWLLASLGLGWLVNWVLILFGILLLTPVLLVVGMRWWLGRNLITSPCPVCDYEFTALNQTQCQCPNCGELLQVDQGRFNRLTPPGTIDVQAIDVSAQIGDQDN
ncbi:MAG: hypothetical protein ACFBSC_22525 [Microcoleaceae cyanobacterium]